MIAFAVFVDEYKWLGQISVRQLLVSENCDFPHAFVSALIPYSMSASPNEAGAMDSIMPGSAVSAAESDESSSDGVPAGLHDHSGIVIIKARTIHRNFFDINSNFLSFFISFLNIIVSEAVLFDMLRTRFPKFKSDCFLQLVGDISDCYTAAVEAVHAEIIRNALGKRTDFSLFAVYLILVVQLVGSNTVTYDISVSAFRFIPYKLAVAFIFRGT